MIRKSRKRFIALVSIAVIAIVIFAEFPIHHFLQPEVNISNQTTFKNFTTDFPGPNPEFSSTNNTIATATITAKNGEVSLFNLSIVEFFSYGSGSVNANVYVNITGHLVSSLDPSGIEFLINASSPTGVENVFFVEFPNYLYKPNDNMNTSSKYQLIGGFVPRNYSVSEETVKLLNKPSWSLFNRNSEKLYNFSYYSMIDIILSGSQGYNGTHYFMFSATLMGLKKTATASVNLTVVNK